MNTFEKAVHDRFNAEKAAVDGIKVEDLDAWTYEFEPNLMQKYVASRLVERGNMGNWSGTGGGKSHSAILAAMLDVDFTTGCVVVFSPNPVVNDWVEKIEGGWNGNIRVSAKNLDEEADFYVLNYEYLQNTTKAAEGLLELLDRRGVQMIVIDEIHKAKIRGENAEDVSNRRQVLERFVGKAKDAKVLGMTATPVINNIREAKSILELIEGTKLDDISDYNCVSSAVEINKHLMIHGIRYIPDYSAEMKVHKPVLEMDADESFDFAQKVGKGRGVNYQIADQELLWTKFDWTVDKLREVGKAVVYCQYVDEIIDPLKSALEAEGFKVGIYSGEDKSGLEMFKSGKIDVLIGSNAIGTGIDGLQHVCSDMIFISLPWTDADYQQAIGRIHRQGQTSEQVDIWIPMVKQVCADGSEVSVDGTRWMKIKKKAQLARAAVDGDFKGEEIEDAEVEKAIGQLIDMLREGHEDEVVREGIDSDLESLVGEDYVSKRVANEFSRMNALWNRSSSSTTHNRLSTGTGRDEWVKYHSAYSEARKSWSVVPAEVLRGWVGDRKNKRIADLGCGEMLMDPRDGKNTILGFDHVAIDDRVVECDISSVPLEDESVDIAVLSLALMGSNYSDYLLEARRIIDIDGYVWIAETLTHVGDDEARIKKSLESYGLNLIHFEIQGKFAFMRCTKLEDVAEDRIELLV